MSVNDPKFEIDPQLVPISGINPLFKYVSPPRQVMLGGNLTQTNVVKGASRKRLRSGFEREHAKGTYKHMFDTDAIVLDVIPRYPGKFMQNNQAENPMDLVIYEDYETKQLNCIELHKFHVMHQHYGFKFKFNEKVMDRLGPNERFKAGTIIADSPNVTEDGDYMIGLEANIAFITDPAGTEDGVVYRAGFAKSLSTRGIETRTFSCGRTHYPTNWNGNAQVYKAIPDIGDRIRSNGLIAAFRPFDQLLDPIYMTGRKLMEPVFGMDVPLYGIADAKVVDIKVYHNERMEKTGLPEEFTAQLRRYYEAEKEYYLRVIKAVLARTGRYLSESVDIHPNLWKIVYEGIIYVGDDLVKLGLWDEKDADRFKVSRGYRGEILDEWRVEITFEYETNVAEGVKGTNLHGGERLKRIYQTY